MAASLKVYAWFNPGKNDRREVVAAPSIAAAFRAFGADPRARAYLSGSDAPTASHAFLLAEPGVVFCRTGLDAPWHRAETEPLTTARSALLGLLAARGASHPDAGLDETEQDELATMLKTLACAEADEAWHRERPLPRDMSAIRLARDVQRWARGRIAEIRGTAPR